MTIHMNLIIKTCEHDYHKQAGIYHNNHKQACSSIMTTLSAPGSSSGGIVTSSPAPGELGETWCRWCRVCSSSHNVQYRAMM